MELSLAVVKNRPELVVTHNGESVNFSGSVFQRKSLEPAEFDVFDPINRYWARLRPADQDAVWKIYKDVYAGFDQIRSSEMLHHHLTKKISELIVYHSLEDIELWVAIDPSFIIPDTVMETFVADEGNKNTPEKTYLRKEYIQLAAFSIFTRSLMPIFGEFIESSRKQTGVDFKEFGAMKLLLGTGILESPAVRKLKSYIGTITKEKKKNFEKILGGNSSLDVDFILLALVTVRKICVSDVYGIEPKSNLVSRVFNFLFQKVNNPTKTTTPIRERTLSDNEGSGKDDKRSFIEAYRKRSDVSIGEIAGFEKGYANLMGTARRMAPAITEEEVFSSVETARALRSERVGDAQLMMMAWVFKSVHSPRSVYYIHNNASLSGAPVLEAVWQNLGVLEAVLWHWGFHYLSVLSTSHMLTSHDAMHISPIDNRGQIPQELQARIHHHYPHIWKTSKKFTNTSVDEPHPIMHSIDLIVDDLVANAWRSTASEKKIVEVFGEVRRKLVIKPNIRSELAELIVHVEDLAEARLSNQPA